MLDAEAQSLALADRIVDDACMLAQHMALPVHEWAGLRLLAGAQFNDAGIVAVRHEADILTVALSGVYKTMLLSQLTRLGLVQRAEREAQMRQLVLIQEIQHIALVLAVVHGLFQEPAAVFLLDAGIVAGNDIIQAVLPGEGQHFIKLHVAVAVNTWIGCSACLIDPDKFFDDSLFKLSGKVQYLIRNIQLKRHLAGIVNIPLGTASVKWTESNVLVSVQTHGGAFTAVPLLQHQIGRNGAVYTAAHCYDRFFHLYLNLS